MRLRYRCNSRRRGLPLWLRLPLLLLRLLLLREIMLLLRSWFRGIRNLRSLYLGSREAGSEIRVPVGC